MHWTGLTAAEARLPLECQRPALKARRRSTRIRVHIAVLFCLYVGWVGFQIVGSLLNVRRDSDKAFARTFSPKLPPSTAGHPFDGVILLRMLDV